MPITSLVGLLFIAVSLVFFGLFCRDCLNKSEQPALARKIRLRMALMFAAVGTGLYLSHIFLH